MLFKTFSTEETLSLGENLGKRLREGDIVLLFGELGAGKTTLTQGIAKGLGVSEEAYVRSPTFTLINEYEGTNKVYHVDLYRIESSEEIEDLGIDEYLFGKGITIVEWAEKLFLKNDKDESPDFGITQYIRVKISILEEESRSFEILIKSNENGDHPLLSLQ